jgi:hypothetical protein
MLTIHNFNRIIHENYKDYAVCDYECRYKSYSFQLLNYKTGDNWKFIINRVVDKHLKLYSISSPQFSHTLHLPTDFIRNKSVFLSWVITSFIEK